MNFSGCEKAAVLKQFHEKYPNYIHYIPNFNSLGPAQMLVKMRDCIGLSLKQRISEITALQERLTFMNGIMYLFNEVSLDYPDSIKKLAKRRDIYMTPGYQSVFAVSRDYTKCCTTAGIMTDTVPLLHDLMNMKGMCREDAGNYLNIVAGTENLKFIYIAQ